MHTRTRNASLPTQANHTARGARKHPPNQGAIHAASEDSSHTSNHTKVCELLAKCQCSIHDDYKETRASPQLYS